MTKENTTHHDSMQDVEQALTSTEQYLEKNWKKLTYIVAAIVAVVVIYLGYQRFVVTPNAIEANEQIFAAQRYFEIDSFSIAIEGDGATLGFLDIIDEYGSTPAGNIANYYTGVSYLHLGEYELAIEYLNKYSTDNIVLAPVAFAAKGDAYVELDDYSSAIKSYKKAISVSENNFTAPIVLIKLGLAYEANGKNAEAVEAYSRIVDEFSTSSEVATAEKYLARLNG